MFKLRAVQDDDLEDIHHVSAFLTSTPCSLDDLRASINEIASSDTDYFVVAESDVQPDIRADDAEAVRAHQANAIPSDELRHLVFQSPALRADFAKAR